MGNVDEERSESEQTVADQEPEDDEVDQPSSDDTDDTEENDDAERHFEVGDVVVVIESFHNPYFRGLSGVVQGVAENSGTSDTLWHVKIDVEPYKLLIPGKYIQLKTEADAERRERPAVEKTASNGRSVTEFLTRFIPWKK